MALTITETGTGGNLAGVFSSMNTNYMLITGDASYPAGGYAVTTTSLGFFQKILGAFGTNGMAGGYNLVFDSVANTLRVYTFPASKTGGMTEVATGTNLTALSLQFVVLGY